MGYWSIRARAMKRHLSLILTTSLIIIWCVVKLYAATFTDNFNRADALNLGANWDSWTGFDTIQIVSNATESQTIGTEARETVNTGTYNPTNDQQDQITLSGWVTTAGITEAMKLMVRYSAPSTDTGYNCEARMNGTFSSRIARLSAGTIAESLTDNTISWGATDTIGCKAIGNPVTMTLLRNG